MANMLLGWPNRIDGSTLSGGGWTSLTNVQTKDSNEWATSTDATTSNTQFDIDLGTTNYTLRAVSLHNHNLSVAAQWRITIGTSSGASDVYDSGFISVWQVAFDNDLAEFESTAYWQELISNQNIKSSFSVISALGNASYSDRYVRIEIDDTGNSDGYITIGRVGVWGGIQPAVNASWGAQNNWEDISEISKSLAGELIYYKRRLFRTADITFDWLTDAEAANVYELMRRQGQTGEVLFVYDPADMAKTQRYGFRGRLRRLSPLEKNYLSTNKNQFRLEELL